MDGPYRGTLILAGIVAVQIGFLTALTTPLPSGVKTDPANEHTDRVTAVTPEALCTADVLKEQEPAVPFRDSNREMYDHPKQTVPAIHVRINEKGLRDEPFRPAKPENTTRILVLGDSFTYGYGLNESQRYTERLEERLDTEFARDVQVINAGISGAGMRDYYEVLYNKGVRYDPDIVITAFSPLDAYGWRERTRWMNQVMDRYNVSAREVLSHAPAKQAYWKKVTGFLGNQSWPKSQVARYGNMIRELGDRRDFDTTFFLIVRGPAPERDDYIYNPLRVGETTYPSALTAWREECGTDIVLAPQKVGESRYRIPGDGHYNAAGNQILAETLSRHLRAQDLSGQSPDTSRKE